MTPLSEQWSAANKRCDARMAKIERLVDLLNSKRGTSRNRAEYEIEYYRDPESHFFDDYSFTDWLHSEINN